MEDKEWEIDNLPNRLTLFRILVIPVVVLSLYFSLYIDSSGRFSWAIPYQKALGYLAACTFGLAAITDFFDGHIARKRRIITIFGRFLDPLADKFLVVSSLILLQAMERIPVLIVVILVIREIYVTSLRSLAQERSLSVPVESLGKMKTITQMVGIPFLMAYDNPWGLFPMPLIGASFIYLACIFSLYSALQYSLEFLKKMKVRKQHAQQK